MHTSSRQHLPLPRLGPRCAAVLSASAKFLFADFVDGASDADLLDALLRFYEGAVAPPLHAAALRRRAGIVRHGLAYLLRGRDTLPAKADACLGPAGAYHVAGLGPQFWSALFQGLSPTRNPAWLPATVAGLRRLGLARWQPGASPGAVYAGLLDGYARIQAAEPAVGGRRPLPGAGRAVGGRPIARRRPVAASRGAAPARPAALPPLHRGRAPRLRHARRQRRRGRRRALPPLQRGRRLAARAPPV